jgi:hypothetical protein
LGVEGSSGSGGSGGSAKPDETALRQVLDRIRLMRLEFEELLFLRYAAEMLRDFRKRLLRERWD